MEGAVRSELDRIFRTNPYLAHVGADIEEWGPGWARVSARPRSEQANIVGIVHGGALAGLADIAFEVACNSYGRICVAVELTAHFTGTAPLEERLIAECREVARSKRIASYRIDVSVSGQVIADFAALAYRTDRWHVPPASLPEDYRDRY